MATDLQNEPKLSELVGGIISDGQKLVGQQFAMFKNEVREEARKTQEILGFLAASFGVALLGVFLLCNALALGIADGLHWPMWAGYLTVGVVMAVLGGVLTGLAYQQFRYFNPLPEKSLAALQENLEWKTEPAHSTTK